MKLPKRLKPASASPRKKRSVTPEQLMSASVCLVAVGVGFVYWPAGLIVLGALTGFLTWMHERDVY